MKTRTWIILASIAVALTLALVLQSLGATRTLAQVARPEANLTNAQAGPGNGMRGRQGMGQGMGQGQGQGQGMGQGMRGHQQMGDQQSLLAVVAQVLGISQDELLTQLQSDKSIADVAGDKTQLIIDTFVAQQSERFATMVTNGSATQEEVDQRIAVMKGMVVGRVNQVWATGVKGRPEGMEPLGEPGQGQGQGMGQGRGQRGTNDANCVHSTP